MNNIKSTFSIKDLENLTGIKAHTIRVWEKRYNLLAPKRTKTNIRYYDLEGFQKLLNVSYLNNNGYKISKIAEINSQEIPSIVTEIATKKQCQHHSINAFKLAMLNFDQTLFYNTYNALLKDKAFDSIFHDVFIPLLNHIGLLWQTKTITPAHEHFITALIRQKILINTEIAQSKRKNQSAKTFVLYLPDNEIHELGLMFINYELVNKGYHSIFLGQSVPMESLTALHNYYNNIVFVSYLTIMPLKETIENYIQEFKTKILTKNNAELWLLGQQVKLLDANTLPTNISTFNSIKALTHSL